MLWIASESPRLHSPLYGGLRTSRTQLVGSTLSATPPADASELPPARLFRPLAQCFAAGFGFAFVAMQPYAQEPFPEVLGLSPLWAPLWGVFGIANAWAGAADPVGQLQPGIWTSPLLIWLYLFVAIIVLVNLLIAQMSDTYARVTGEGLLRWQFERAQLINEFMRKKPLPPPLNVFWFGLITLPSKLRVWYRSTYREEVEASEAGFTLVPSQQDLDKLQAREGEALKRCLQVSAARPSCHLEQCQLPRRPPCTWPCMPARATQSPHISAARALDTLPLALERRSRRSEGRRRRSRRASTSCRAPSPRLTSKGAPTSSPSTAASMRFGRCSKRSRRSSFAQGTARAYSVVGATRVRAMERLVRLYPFASCH